MDDIEDAKKFGKMLDELIRSFPELFPDGIEDRYLSKETRPSRKTKIPTRRIVVGAVSYTVRPSFVMPCHAAFTAEAEKALFLGKFNVPFWATGCVFGRDAMHWRRMEQSPGGNSVAGTTVKAPDLLPQHLGADEKHSRLEGGKVYAAATVGSQCMPGVSVSEDAGEKGPGKACGKFKEEALNPNPEYSPKSADTDSWKATVNVWKWLFPSIFAVCRLPRVFIKIRDRSCKKFAKPFKAAADKLWNCCKAASKSSFSQRVRRLCEWAANEELRVPEVVSKPILKLKENPSSYSKACDLPGCHRTSNMADRLTRRMDRRLFSTFYFHGSLASAESGIRGWALIHNFAPCNPTTVKKHDGWRCPAERLNKSRYHENWLQNLLTSASMGGFKQTPPNPL